MKTTEQYGIRISLAGASLFAILGIAFALLTKSQAVLLDGAFNLITAVMVLFAMRITRLLGEPETERRPAGYVALEPLYILIKGLVLLVLTLFVMASNVIILIRGGNELNLGIITIYIGIAVIGNFLVWFLIHQKHKGTASPLLRVEKQNWLVNTLISAGIGISFLVVFILKDGALKVIVPYVDQIVVILVGLVSLSVPVAAIREGMRELLLFGPDESVQLKIREIIASELDELEIRQWKAFILKTGRKYWVTLMIDPAKDTIEAEFSDALIVKLMPVLNRDFPSINLDILITRKFQE